MSKIRHNYTGNLTIILWGIFLSVYAIIQLTRATANDNIMMWIAWFAVLFVIVYSTQTTISILIEMKILRDIDKNYNLKLALQQIIYLTINNLDANSTNGYDKIRKIAHNALRENKNNDEV